MFTRAELEDAVNQLMDGHHSIQNCEKLAAIYTVLDHLEQPKQLDYGYSYDNKVEAETVIGNYGDSRFLQRIIGKPTADVWHLIDELVDALRVLNPRLINNFFSKLDEL